MRDVSTQYKLYTCIKCLINIRGQIQYKQHAESCDKHYCHVCNKRFHSNQLYQKYLKKNCPQRFACQNCTKTYSKKSDRDTHNRKCIKTSSYKYDRHIEINITNITFLNLKVQEKCKVTTHHL